MRLTELAGRRVALWGFGREGRASMAALRSLPVPPSEIVIVTDRPPSDAEAAAAGIEWTPRALPRRQIGRAHV